MTFPSIESNIKTNQSFYRSETDFIKTTFDEILEKLNILMSTVIAQDQNLRHLIPDYIDTLGLYISNITDVQMA